MRTCEFYLRSTCCLPLFFARFFFPPNKHIFQCRTDKTCFSSFEVSNEISCRGGTRHVAGSRNWTRIRVAVGFHCSVPPLSRDKNNSHNVRKWRIVNQSFTFHPSDNLAWNILFQCAAFLSNRTKTRKKVPRNSWHACLPPSEMNNPTW